MIDDSDADRLIVIHHHVEDPDEKVPVCFGVAIEVVVIQIGEQKVEIPHVHVMSKVVVDLPGIEVLVNHSQNTGGLIQVFLAKRKTANGRLI